MTKSRVSLIVGGLVVVGILAALGYGYTQYQAQSTPTSTKPASAHWTYEGEEGPENWGKLDPAYTLCSDGSAQTPIDIMNPVKKDIVDPVFGYQNGAVGITNNGHTIQAVAADGNTITLDGQVFTLAQMHFHAPSEHAINGKKFAIEAHFVHKNSDGKLAVVGVMLDEGSSDSAAWEPFVQSLGTVKGTDGTATLDWGQLLPTSTLTYQYAGSLTTPPCSEGVHWVLMQDVVQLSARQIAAFTAAYDGTDRPIQPVGNREVAVDVSGN
jgi:carbonic anhydrase